MDIYFYVLNLSFCFSPFRAENGLLPYSDIIVLAPDSSLLLYVSNTCYWLIFQKRDNFFFSLWSSWQNVEFHELDKLFFLVINLAKCRIYMSVEKLDQISICTQIDSWEKVGFSKCCNLSTNMSLCASN